MKILKKLFYKRERKGSHVMKLLKKLRLLTGESCCVRSPSWAHYIYDSKEIKTDYTLSIVCSANCIVQENFENIDDLIRFMDYQIKCYESKK